MQHPTTEVDEHWAVQLAIVGGEPQLALGRHGEEKALVAQNETNHFLPFAFCTFVGDDHASRGCAVP
jgi:hypothetical protein